MLVAGCDIGSTTGKAVIMDNGQIMAYTIIPCLPNPVATAYLVMEEVLEKAGLSSLDQVEYIVGTGYGRIMLPFAHSNISEITCHGRGAWWLSKSVRTIIDIGGQDCKVIALHENGMVRDFTMNDKCAAGTGKFLESLAQILEIGLEDLSTLSLKAESPAIFSNQCTVFVEAEIITLINRGRSEADIVSGVHTSIANRLSSLVKNVGFREDLVLAGGCAKNLGLTSILEEKLKTRIKRLPEDPQIIGALGAALIARESLEKKAGKG